MCSICKIYKSKILTKHVSCECRCKFDGRKCNSNEQWNNDKCRWGCKKHHIFEKGYIWNPSTCSCKNVKYLLLAIQLLLVMKLKTRKKQKLFQKIYNL